MNARNKNHIAVSTANMEPYFSNGADGKKALTGLDTQCSIHLHSRRYRLADSDGISGKAAIDGLVNAGLLKDDSPAYVKEVSYSQGKIAKTDSEETIITITF